MAAAVYSFTKPTDVRGYKEGNKNVRFFDWTSDTGDYAAGGVTKTAASLGFSHIDFVEVGSVATQGTSGASALGVGVTYVSSGTSVKFQLYESAGSGSPPVEKGNEAMVANFTVRIKVTGSGTGA
jgi:hypothetical protein